jgi:hypothetical protein
MQTHRITSQPWQIEAAAKGILGVIILPLVPEIEPHIDGINMIWRNKKVTAWITKLPSEIAQCSEFPYQNGDRIYLAEEWCNFPGRLSTGEPPYYELRSNYPPLVMPSEKEEWQPAEMMPEEAAQYWFEVGDVRVAQMSDISSHLQFVSGLIRGLPRGEITENQRKLFSNAAKGASIHNWNIAHPDHLWREDRHVIVLEIKKIQ